MIITADADAPGRLHPPGPAGRTLPPGPGPLDQGARVW